MTTAKAPEVPEAVVKGFHGHLIFGGHGPDGHNKGHWSMFFFSDIDGDDKFRFAAVNVFVASGNGTPGVIADKPKLNDGEWHHIAGVRDEGAKELRAYIDGEFVGRGREISQERLTTSRIAIKPEKRYGWGFMRSVMGAIRAPGSFLRDMMKCVSGIDR